MCGEPDTGQQIGWYNHVSIAISTKCVCSERGVASLGTILIPQKTAQKWVEAACSPRITAYKEILPVTLRERKEQAKLGELTVEDDDWLKLIGSRRETLQQRFAQTIGQGTSIDTTAGIEHTD